MTAFDHAVLSVDQMRQAEGLSGLSATALMENAGVAVAREIIRRWPAQNIGVLCGPGGGDGFVVARHLQRAGWPVRLARLDRDLRGAALHHADLSTGPTVPLDDLTGAALIVDALFGAGLSRPFGGPAAAVLGSAGAVIAIDLPSGVNRPLFAGDLQPD